ncbi:MAG: hypothetical protein OEZ13_13740 [Spirochaetia bacterium]|nr:hypothetical protein [Spirochaetia bacterium]
MKSLFWFMIITMLLLLVNNCTVTRLKVNKIERPVILGPIQKIGGGSFDDPGEDFAVIDVRTMYFHDKTYYHDASSTTMVSKSYESNKEKVDYEISSLIEGPKNHIFIDAIEFEHWELGLAGGGVTQKNYIRLKGAIYSGGPK